VASLVDTNVLVYRFDPRDPAKQRRAMEMLHAGLLDDNVVLAHQCIVEFVAAVIRPRQDLDGAPLLPLEDARVIAERLTAQFPILYPTREVVLTALRGTAMYGLAWFDAHLWAYAEVYGIEEIISEDFEHGRHYGTVRAVNPFVGGDAVHELPALYSPHSEPPVTGDPRANRRGARLRAGRPSGRLRSPVPRR
jgi:predicted nucleic acid-binding protein